MLETVLDKERIFEIYLNSVEWGRGVYGAEAAARYYHRIPASRLGAWQSARLAVMLPKPRWFDAHRGSAYRRSARRSSLAGWVRPHCRNRSERRARVVALTVSSSVRPSRAVCALQRIHVAIISGHIH